MATGKIKNWIGDRGFGFITDETGGQDVFFHINGSPDLRGEEESLVPGKVVVFDKRPSERHPGRFEARNVRLQEASPLTQQTTDFGPSTDETHEHFYNPYTFVPSPPRQKAIRMGGFAGDFDPLAGAPALNHASLDPKLWTGHIPIELTTVTPLVLLKTEGKDHPPDKPYDVLDHIPESSLRGMLRSAYEVVTNSRYGRFSNSDRLAYRMAARKALELVPAIIENGTGPRELVASLCTGTSYPTAEGPKKSKGNKQKGPMYAAMLTLYGDKKLRSECDAGYTPKTGDEVWAEIVLCQHDESSRGERRWFSQYQPWRNYIFWKVVKVWPKTKNGQPTKKPIQTGGTPWFSTKPQTHPRDRQSYYAPLNPKNPQRRVVKGRVLITNENMKGKHDERIFFVEGENAKNPIQHDVTNLKEAWRMRIQSYRNAHSDREIFKRKGAIDEPWKNIGDDPGETAWSPHQYQDNEHRSVWRKDPHGRATMHDALELQPGDMVYARCKFDSNEKIEKIKDLFPVMISRELYANRPADLFDSSLKPAGTRGELSPADRLFGWVPQEGGDDAGYKSRLRVVCEDSTKPDTIIESFSDSALPLAILGQPKPAQGRFYVAKDAEGNPQRPVSKEQAGYDASGGKGLRGRKQYWHHKGLEADKAKEYWHPSAEDRTQEKRDGRYQEYRRPNENGKKNGKPKADSQNRFIKGWIKPNTVFEASLYVQNLQSEELGGLLWLLTLNDGIGDGDEKHHFRLGHGKPLGFGSVKVEIDKERLVNGCLPLGTGEDWKGKYYTAFDASPPATLDRARQTLCIQAFKASMVAAYNPLPDNNATETDGDEKEVSNLTSFDQLGRIQSRFLNTPEARAQLEEQHFAELPFISGFLQVLSGPKKDVPIHYPRTNKKPDPAGENFRWFDKNENGPKLTLPAVTDKKGLPYQP